MRIKPATYQHFSEVKKADIYKIFLGVLIFTISILPFTLQAQNCDDTRKACSGELLPFVSDGQFRSANLKANQSQRFRCTFYGDRLYKLVLGTGGKLGNVRFKILSSTYKTLFDSANQGYPATWKLKFKNTSDFILEISLIENTDPGCAIMLVGFETPK